MGREGNSVYRLSPAEIQQIELDVVRRPGIAGFEIFPRKADHERHFWSRSGGYIGACKGERTEFIYVIYHLDGTVHGYPITEALLRQKGVEL
jgi:hypothetical protein